MKRISNGFSKKNWFNKNLTNFLLKIKTSICFLVLIISFAFSPTNANAVELDEAVRTVPLNGSGKTVVLSLEEAKRGKRLFNAACSLCHIGGITKTNPNVGLEPEALSLATPTRNNIEALIDYMKNPTSYDGLESIAEIHPSIKSADIYPKMRALSEEDLYAIAGHILLQPRIISEKWGGGKIYF